MAFGMAYDLQSTGFQDADLVVDLDTIQFRIVNVSRETIGRKFPVRWYPRYRPGVDSDMIQFPVVNAFDKTVDENFQ